MRIAVVGGGFSGLVFAYKLARRGYDVELYEEHTRVGFPPHCTGLVSSDTVELIGPPARRSIQATYRGVELEAGGSRCRINTRNRVVKLDRIRLEWELLEEAESHGARIRLGVRVDSLSREGVVSTREGGSRSYDLVVLAEGLHGRLRSLIGVEHRVVTTFGLNRELRGEGGEDGGYVWIGFEEGLEGFRWRLPTPGALLVGALSRDPKRVKRAVAGGAGEGAGLYGGIVVHGPPLERPRRGRVLVVGDAAGFNKPLTGGGLYPNALLASMASSIDLAGDRLEGLDGAVSKLVGRLRRQYRIARGYYRDPDAGARLLKAAFDAGLCSVLDGRIDYDGHEALLGLVAGRPLAALRILASMAWRAGGDLYSYLLSLLGLG